MTMPARKTRPASVAHEDVGLVGGAVEELGVVGQLVVDLQHGGDRDQDQEAEVDQRVHDAGHGVPQQGLHVDAGAEVAHAPLDVPGGGRPVVGGAPLPVPHPEGEEHGAVDQQGRDHRVEGDLQGVRDVPEHLPVDRRLLLEAGEAGGDAGADREEGDGDAEADDELLGREPLHDAAEATRGDRPVLEPGDDAPGSAPPSSGGRHGPSTRPKQRPPYGRRGADAVLAPPVRCAGRTAAHDVSTGGSAWVSTGSSSTGSGSMPPTAGPGT